MDPNIWIHLCVCFYVEHFKLIFRIAYMCVCVCVYIYIFVYITFYNIMNTLKNVFFAYIRVFMLQVY